VSLSKRRKIQQLLHAEELVDPKASQLLRRLQQLHGTSGKELLRELFLQRLPSNVQIGLLSHPDKPLADLAVMADGMIEQTDARQSIAQIETPESAEISSIRSDLNKVLKLLDTSRKVSVSITLDLVHRLRNVVNPVPIRRRETTSPVTSRGAREWGFLKPPVVCDGQTFKLGF
jgi:hypothetical protein